MDIDRPRKFIEEFDPRKLQFVINNADTLVDADGQKLKPHYVKEVLVEYLKRSSDGKATTTYGKNTEGRLFTTQIGIQNIHRSVRHTICRGSLEDIDFENCHVNLMVQYAQKNGLIVVPVMVRYMNECSAMRAEIVESCGVPMTTIDKEKPSSKGLMLKLLYGGGFESAKYPNAPQWVLDFKYAARTLLKEISNHPDNKALKKIFAKKTVKPGVISDPESSITSMRMGIIENEAMWALYDHVTNHGFDVQVLVFDGLMTKKEDGRSVASVLGGASDHVFNSTGYRLNVAVKPMDSGWQIDTVELDKIVVNDSFSYESYKKIFEYGEDERVFFVKKHLQIHAH